MSKNRLKTARSFADTLSAGCNSCRLILVISLLSFTTTAQTSVSKVWVADNRDGTYRNPILHADYSDPDVVRMGDDFYLTASSFNSVPGLPILHSRDLVNWTIIGHVFSRQPPFDVFSKPQHGNGVWAPAIRYHNNEFYIFYPDPDYGIYMVKAVNPAGPWSDPLLIKAAKGWIDPCPFWDDDGNAYLVSALARSRSGVKSILVVSRMSVDGTKLLDEGAIVFDGHEKHPTVEGPKFYKRNGYYYIFAPAGGVESGWQLALRSKKIFGPYEERIVLAQGKTRINGPHQGAWVETPQGESWFLHFQDRGPYGRIVHLQPMRWLNDWPVMGIDADGDGTGEPVLSFQKPRVGGSYPLATPQDSDDFNDSRPGLQWQWHANPQANWAFVSSAYGFLRLFNVPLPKDFRNFWDVPNLLLQKFPAPSFTATTKITFTARSDSEKTGLIVMGLDYANISITKRADGLYVSQVTCKDADKQTAEKETPGVRLTGNNFFLRVRVKEDAICDFSYSVDGKTFSPLGEPFSARQGRWIGAKVGIFAVGSGNASEMGYADFDWFRFE
ncbi:MAG: glycoside hydrolase 43 family protein [Pyrinomonadaceae bacterium]|nr:glycoside hydrolase 43 family protein [Pyrinomonadaceae bacterium]